MLDPQPVLRQAPLEILCTLGWVQATLHLPAHQGLDEALALSGPSLKLTNVRIPRDPEPHGFLALRRDSISLVVPVMGAHIMSGTAYGPTRRREVACLLSDSMLRGVVEIPAGLRLSDFLRLDSPFLVVRQGMLAPYGGTLQSSEARALDLALVNREHIVGVSEPAEIAEGTIAAPARPRRATPAFPTA